MDTHLQAGTGEPAVPGKAACIMQSNDEQDTLLPVIPVCDGSLIHRPGNPFCYDETCGCHEDPELIAAVADAVSQGLLTAGEATRLVAGKTV